MSESRLSPRVIDYPSSDGKPMTESEAQFLPLTYAALALREHFEQRGDVYVGANMFLYFEENNPRAVVAPDVFVVVGAPKHVRDSYLLWNEPKGPDFVLEITSRSTRHQDQGRKKRIYASLGVGEYFLFDPTGDYLRPRLQGFVLRQGRYERLPAAHACRRRRCRTASRASRARRSGFTSGPGRRTAAVRPGQRSRPVLLLGVGQGARAAGGSRREDSLWPFDDLTSRATKAEAMRKAAEHRAAKEEAARKAAEARIAELEAHLRNSRG